MPLVVPPDYYMGKALSNAQIIPCTVSSTGVVTKGAVNDIAALSGNFLTFESCSFDSTLNLTEISPANLPIESYSSGKDTFEVTLSEIRYSDPSGNALPILWASYNIFIVNVMVQPFQSGFALPFTVQCVCIRSTLGDPYANEKGVIEFKGRPKGLPLAFIPKGGSLVY